jgi:hypothetical protein
MKRRNGRYNAINDQIATFAFVVFTISWFDLLLFIIALAFEVSTVFNL